MMPKVQSKVTSERFADETDPHYLEIVDGPFAGICFNYGKIEFLGEDTDGQGRIAFEYKMLHVPEGIKITKLNESQFDTELAFILKDILESIAAADRDKELNED